MRWESWLTFYTWNPTYATLLKSLGKGQINYSWFNHLDPNQDNCEGYECPPNVFFKKTWDFLCFLLLNPHKILTFYNPLDKHKSTRANCITLAPIRMTRKVRNVLQILPQRQESGCSFLFVWNHTFDLFTILVTSKNQLKLIWLSGYFI